MFCAVLCGVMLHMAEQPKWPRWTALEQMRWDAGLNHRALGEKAGLDHETVRAIELGLRYGRPDTLKKLATALGTTVAHLRETRPTERIAS